MQLRCRTKYSPKTLTLTYLQTFAITRWCWRRAELAYCQVIILIGPVTLLTSKLCPCLGTHKLWIDPNLVVTWTTSTLDCSYFQISDRQILWDVRIFFVTRASLLVLEFDDCAAVYFGLFCVFFVSLLLPLWLVVSSDPSPECADIFRVGC